MLYCFAIALGFTFFAICELSAHNNFLIKWNHYIMQSKTDSKSHVICK